jgi:hypothetical protein
MPVPFCNGSSAFPTMAPSELLHARNRAGLDLCQNDPVESSLTSGSAARLAGGKKSWLTSLLHIAARFIDSSVALR